MEDIVINGECAVIRSGAVKEMLALPAQDGKRELEPLKAFSRANNVPLNILEDTNVDNEVEVHVHMGDLWYCLEGEVTFTHGGEPVDPRSKVKKDGTIDEDEIRAQEIKNGTTTILSAGDWLWIPPGVAHKHQCRGTAKLAIIKIPKG